MPKLKQYAEKYAREGFQTEIRRKQGESMDKNKTAPLGRGAEDEIIERQNRFIIGVVVNIFVSMVTALLVLKAMGVI